MPTIKPKKSLGQNFLRDRNISKKIVNSLDIHPNDIVIEIGPGEGALTCELICLPVNLIAIEIDERACNELQQQFPAKEFPHFKLIKSDFMELDLPELISTLQQGQKIKIIGNLPYYISSRILYKVIENAGNIEKAVFMVQKEVAERLASRHGNKTYGILTVAVNYAGTISKLFDVSPQCFYPRPKVTSTVIGLNFREGFDAELFKGLMSIVKSAFNQRRKKLRNALSAYYQSNFNESIDKFFAKNGLESTGFLSKRAEDLSYQDYILLWKMMKE